MRRTCLMIATACLIVVAGGPCAIAESESKAAPVILAAKPIPTELPAMSAQQVAERNAAARGGLAAWRKVSSMTLAGKLDAGKQRKDGGEIAEFANPKARMLAKAELRKALAEGKLPTPPEAKVIQLPFQMDLKRPTLTRLEVPFQGQTAVQVYDGKQGWKLRPFLGRHEIEPFTDAELKIAASQQELDGALMDYRAKGTSIELEGSELLEGRGAYRLKLTFRNGEVRHLWIDGQTFLDVKIEDAPRRWDGKWRTVTTWYRDYKSVDGLQIAHRLETRLEGIPSAENIYIERVALNPRLDAARFQKPM